MVKSSLVSEDDGRDLMAFCSCGDSTIGELEEESGPGGRGNGDGGRLDCSRVNLRGASAGEGPSGSSARASGLDGDRMVLKRAVNDCRLLGEVVGWRGALPVRDGPGTVAGSGEPCMDLWAVSCVPAT